MAAHWLPEREWHMLEPLTRSHAPGSYPAVYRNLMLVGLLGAIYRSGDDTQVVNKAVELTLVDTTMFTMCRAIALGMGGDGDFARTNLGAHLEHHTDDDSAKLAMAVSLMLAGDQQWKHLIDNLLATSTDQTVRDAAHGVLSYLDKLKPVH